MRRLSIRGRIVFGSTAVVVVLVLVACIAVYAQISAIAVAREKAVLHGIAEVYRGIILEEPDEPFEKPGVSQHVAIVSPDGTVRLNTLPRALQSHIPELLEPGPHLRELSDGETYFVYVDVVTTPQGEWTVLVTRDSDIAAGVVAHVSGLLWVLLIGTAALFAVGAWAVATAALRPVERLRRGADRVSRHVDDVELLPVSGADDEIDALAHTLNRLISEVRSSSERERQMVADASHELRNPLTVLRAQLELADGTDPDGDRILLAEARSTLNTLIRLAQAMLDLSRIEAGPGGESTLRTLAETVTACIDRVHSRMEDQESASQDSVSVRIDISDPDAVAGIDPTDLERVLDNLVDNALRAGTGEHPTHVAVELTQHAGDLELIVSDDGPGFDPLIVDRAFERFTRSPSSDYPGGGLGLAIVARIAELAGGTAVISPVPVGAVVSIRLPLTRSSSDARGPNTHQR